METPAFGDDIDAQARMKQMHDLIEVMTGWLAGVQKMGGKVQKLLEVKDKFASTFKSGIGRRAAPGTTVMQTATVQTSGPAFPVPEEHENENKNGRGH